MAQQMVKYAAMDMFNTFTDRQARVLTIGDSNGFNCNCPNHPAGTHASLHAVDVDYYTLKSNNNIQYGRPITNMWDVNEPAGTKLIPGVFDAERNSYFLKSLSKLLPDMRARTNNILLLEMLEYEPTLIDIVSADNGAFYNHHTHFHLDLYRR